MSHTFARCVRFSHGRRFFDSRNVQKRATKSDSSGPCLLATTFAPLQHGSVLPPSTPPPPVLVSTPPLSPVSTAPLDFSLSDRLYLAVSPTVSSRRLLALLRWHLKSLLLLALSSSFLLLPLSIRLRESGRVVPIFWPKILSRGSHCGLTTAGCQVPRSVYCSVSKYGFVL